MEVLIFLREKTLFKKIKAWRKVHTFESCQMYIVHLS